MRSKATYLFFLLLCAVVQGTRAANAEVKFIQKSWDGGNKTVVNTEQTITDYTELSGSHSGDWLGLGVANGTGDYYYVVKSGEQVSYQTLNVFGRVHLILSDNSTLTCTGGIKVEARNNAQLFIYSQRDGDVTGGTQEGRLTVTNSYRNAAGIGSSEAQHCGPITIYGGVINATGAAYGAGIGSGACTSDISTLVGDIVVYGGRITANGGESGAGIGGGGGYRHSQYANGGKFTIYGGTVAATGGKTAAGLGGGGGYSLIVLNANATGGDGGEVYVYGGSLTAKGGHYGAGIGSGVGSRYKKGFGGKMYVYGGEVFATGGDSGAGIGGGVSWNGGEVYINGGSVKAHGGDNAAGIGSGSDVLPEFCPPSSLEITAGNVIAIGGEFAAGIGGGRHSSAETVTIKGGTVTALAGQYHSRAIGDGKNPILESLKLTLSDNLMVSVDNNANNIENVSTVVSTAEKRLDDCSSNRYARIEPCPHTKQNDDADNKVTTYTLTDTEHTSHCLYCNHTATEAHTYPDNANCVCGKKYNATTDLVSVKIYTSSDGSTYGDAKTERVVKANNFVLPKPAAVDGLTFMGYLQTTTAPGSIEMKDSEFNSLVHPGMTVTPTADITYHARYRYDYTDAWTWAADYSSATVTVTWAKGGAKLENLKATVYPDASNPTNGAAGDYNYTATYAYQKADDVVYNFSDNVSFKILDNLILNNGQDNTETIDNNIGNKVNTLTLSGRTFYKDGSWNTLCLPFDLTAEQVTSQLAPASLKTLLSSSYADGKLTINFADATTIEAGKPYIIKWASVGNQGNPDFTNVTISGGTSSVETDCVTFEGTYSPVTLEANNKSVLYLGAGNKLYYPSADVTLNACRGAFVLKGITAGDKPASARSIVLNFGDDDATAITTVSTPASPASDAWYALDGRRLSGKPSQKGIYIHNGQKRVIK